jgi:hypothetical protein
MALEHSGKFTVRLILSAVFAMCTLTAQAQRQAPSGWVEDSAPVKPSPQVIHSGQVGKLILQGGVEHSQQLQRLPSYLQTGSIFSNRLLSSPATANEWYWIPDWLAGDWRRDQETVVSTYSFESGTQNNLPHTVAATELAQFGVQRDRFNGVWHCRLAGSGVADCGSYLSIALVQSQEPVMVSQQKVEIKDVFTELHVNKETSVIIDSMQAESLTTYEPNADGSLKVSTSVKVFDESGMPKREEHSVSITAKTKVFVPLDLYKGRDLKQSFKQFMLASGKANYLP